MATLEGITALIIEDDAISVNVLQRLLEQLGVEVTVLPDYQVADNLLLVAIPHVIFLDLEMPSVNGYDVLNMIRNSASLSMVPVIAYTTHISHMGETKLAGFDGFLGKPLDPAVFPEQVGRILNGESVWEAQ